MKKLCFLLAFLYSQVWAQTVTVQNLNDSGAGSLRDALASLPSTGSHIIDFASGIQGGTIFLQSPFQTNKNVLIDGGSGITLDGQFQNYVMEIQPGGVVRLDKLTLQRGGNLRNPTSISHGAGIRNFGNLRLQECVVQHNAIFGDYAAGAGIYNMGDLEIRDSKIKENYCKVVNGNSSSPAGRGGGIYSGGSSLTLIDSYISANKIEYGASSPGVIGGAGLSMGGPAQTVRIIHSTFDNNGLENLTGTASNTEGTALIGADIGRLFIESSTFSENTNRNNSPVDLSIRGGVMLIHGDTVSIRNSTFGRNYVDPSGSKYFSARGNMLGYFNIAHPTITHNLVSIVVRGKPNFIS